MDSETGAAAVAAGKSWLPMLVMLASHRSTTPEHVLDHPMRRRIVEFLEEQPMPTKTVLRKALDCSWGTISHHLDVLERDRVVKHVRVGRSDRYFLPDVRVRDVALMGTLDADRVRALAKQIVKVPGVMQRDLAQKLDMSRKMLRAYVERLKVAGLVTEAYDGRNRVYLPAVRLPRLLDRMDTAPARGTGPRASSDGRDSSARPDRARAPAPSDAPPAPLPQWTTPASFRRRLKK